MWACAGVASASPCDSTSTSASDCGMMILRLRLRLLLHLIMIMLLLMLMIMRRRPAAAAAAAMHQRYPISDITMTASPAGVAPCIQPIGPDREVCRPSGLKLFRDCLWAFIFEARLWVGVCL